MRDIEKAYELMMNYKKLSRELSDRADELRAVWDDEAGEAFYAREKALASEMEEGFKRLKKWLG
ncbi:MAG: hypothetical protein IKE52_07430 [Mogibacterium sp.]|nr:hypothetical protein [Mogibacterium sp.]